MPLRQENEAFKALCTPPRLPRVIQPHPSCFIVPLEGDHPAQCADRCAPIDASTTWSRRYAVTDGVSQSFMPAHWASLIATSFVQRHSDFYDHSAVVHPDHPYLLRHVLRSTLDAWVDRYPEQYVTRAYAQSVSERGDLLISQFFLQPRYDLAPNAYMLDLARPGRAKLIRDFQEKLKAKAPLPPELQAVYE